MLSRISFASFLVYAPRGTNDLSNRAKLFVRALKEERLIGIPPQSPSDYAARRLAEERAGGPLNEFFADDPILVPVPRSSLAVEGGIWPAFNIASALVRHGVGASVIPCLERVKAVPKSAFAGSGFRPRPAEHYDSLRVNKMVTDRQVMCLVDDVLTKGATLIAAATRLKESYPAAEIAAFAVVRTLGFVDDIDAIVHPVVGWIDLRGDEAHREP